jgi:hypothetical protein
MGTIKNIKTAAQVAGIIAGSVQGTPAALQYGRHKQASIPSKVSTSIQQPRNQAKTSGR